MKIIKYLWIILDYLLSLIKYQDFNSLNYDEHPTDEIKGKFKEISKIVSFTNKSLNIILLSNFRWISSILLRIKEANNRQSSNAIKNILNNLTRFYNYQILNQFEEYKKINGSTEIKEFLEKLKNDLKFFKAIPLKNIDESDDTISILIKLINENNRETSTLSILNLKKNQILFFKNLMKVVYIKKY